MKNYILTILLIVFAISGIYSQNFNFAHITDTHIGTETAKEDLERTVIDINKQDLDFVIVTGDITEMGTDEELASAKETLSKIQIPYYVIPGNHDTGWSESGGVSFIKEFGYDKFVFEHKGYKIIGCASGPYVRMSDGHIPRDAIVWLDSVLASTPKDQRIIFANHYPLDNSLDNWYEATDRLKQYNTQFAICGHGHRNKSMNFEGIPAAMGRSNLRAEDNIGGYTIIEIAQNEAVFKEKIPGKQSHKAWRKIDLGKRDFNSDTTAYERPSYKINDSFPQVTKKWSYHSNANVISTPYSINEVIVFGNSTGTVEALSKETGAKIWEYTTKGGIFSSPAGYKSAVIFASGDGTIYSLNSENGQLLWKFQTNASVLGSPVIENDVVYIGGSDGNFRALNAVSGKEIWNFEGLEGPVVSKALIYDSIVVFGAWDKNLYALNKKDGKLEWKWSNGSPNRMFSPAMVIPVAAKDAIYIVAPDRYLSAINAEDGKTLWRSNEATVRESLGISKNKEFLYAKTMNDTLVAFKTSRNSSEIAWKLDLKYGYDHVPSMIIERNNTLFFGGRNGLVFSVDPETRRHNWSYKIDNSMVNTVNVIDDHHLVAATMDGKIVLLEW